MHGVVEYNISPVRGPLANAFVIMINALFFGVKLIGLTDIYPSDISSKLLNEEETVFDFIIVGAGSAGCMLANKITEQEQWSVLLIEAGDYPSATTEVPALYTTLIGSKEDWQFQIEKDPKACTAYQNEHCTISRGKVLGGTSTISDMLYVRGLPEDFDRNEFIKWDSTVAYRIFDEIEGYKGPAFESHNYNNSGPLHLELENLTMTSKTMLLDAYTAAGCPRMPKRSYLGSVEKLLMVNQGKRFNAAKAFLNPVMYRPNLFFTKNTEVVGIAVTEPVDKRVSGVNVSIDGIQFFLRARKEVILTAGAINNAKLLLVSGIGSREYLTKKSIPLVADIPAVGKNLQMHLIVPLFVSIDPHNDSHREYYKEVDLIRDTFEYVLTGGGNFSHTGINNFVNYYNPNKKGAAMPSLAIHHMYFKIGDRMLEGWLDVLNFHPKIMNSLLEQNKQKSLLLFLPKLTRPLSRGEVLLNDTHYLSNPIIKGNFMTDHDDQDYQTLMQGFSFLTNLTDYMKNVDAEFLNLDIPNCRNFKFCSSKYVKCYINNLAFPSNDLTGTTKMGPECDKTAVVKDDLEVRSIRCLRVADSSVLNNIPVGTTVTNDAMIGFHMGVILKEKWIKGYEAKVLEHPGTLSPYDRSERRGQIRD